MEELESGCRAGDGGRRPDAEGGGAGKGIEEHDLVTRQSSTSSSCSKGWRRQTGGAEACGLVTELGQVSFNPTRPKWIQAARSQLYPLLLRAKPPNPFPATVPSVLATKSIPRPRLSPLEQIFRRCLQPPRPATAPLSPPKCP
jgi:hypothetical protein